MAANRLWLLCLNQGSFHQSDQAKGEVHMKRVNLPPVIAGMDTEELLKSSRAARAGARFIQAGALLRASSTLVTSIIICILPALPALAQSVLGNDASRPVSFAKRCIDVLAWGMILYGVYGLGKGVMRGINGQQGWGSSIGWGAGGLGFGFIVSWINAEINGNQVALPEP
jgi:hypothetical protein